MHLYDWQREQIFETAAQLQSDRMRYGTAYIDKATGQRIDPATIHNPLKAKSDAIRRDASQTEANLRMMALMLDRMDDALGQGRN